MDLKKRSSRQNDYYWHIVCPLVMEGLRGIGYNEVRTKEDAHVVMKNFFRIESTAKLETKKFNEYLEDVWQWAAEWLNIQIPMPNENKQEPILLASYDKEVEVMIVEPVK